MGSLIRAMDWSATSLGPVAGWPQSLRTTISICLASDLPICVIWGPGLVQLYNDAYRVIIGSKHPRSLGQNFSECFTDAWPVIGRAHDSALAGDTAFLEAQQIFLQRRGYVEETFFTFSFSPIRDEAGRVGGLFHPVIEMTTQMLGERRTRALRDLAAQTSKAESVSEALCLSAQTLAQHNLDLPFTLFYSLHADGDHARLIDSTGLQADTVASMSRIDLAEEGHGLWPLQEVVRSGVAVEVRDLAQRIGLAGPYPESPNAALVLPITPPGVERPVAVFVAGISSRLAIDEAYRSFCDLLAAGVTRAVANARAHEDERRRAQALADLDRAKIAFFSNVSHEFRTPLTLILGPIEDALAESGELLPPLQRERLQLVHRNGLRLQRLVNSLLDFSRIEAGRVRAAYEPTALADFTGDLASNFRSACERAGLALRVDCPPFGEPVFVDRPMWEKIVLNLLSNAFKFTFAGEVAVSMRQVDLTAELRVQDTGTGVPAKEIPLLFERFHRVENARGRTHEGSGIGLALVQELVKLHGGSITAESVVGSGTTFTVRVPLGSRHLPPDQVGNGRAAALQTTQVGPFVEEALRWLPDTDWLPTSSTELPPHHGEPASAAVSTQLAGGDRPLVLVADDNADMRQYILRLLGQHYRTEAVPDGEAALAAVRERIPDLILADVMMPRLDGLALLQALRADPRTSRVPVIMLSARAGEESRIEGMQEGADDYMVKPFSAKELLARVSAHLKMARMRLEASKALRASEEQFRALISASSDVVYRMNADWTEMYYLQGREFIADTPEPNRSWLEKYIHPADQRRVMQAIREAIRSKSIFELEHRVLRIDGTMGWTFSRAIPLLDSDGSVVEWFGMASDATARRRAEEALRESEQKYRTLFESMDEGYCVIEMIFDTNGRPADYLITEVNPAFEKHTGLQNAQGKRMRELAPDHDAHWFEIYGRVAVTGEPIRFEEEAKALDGRWFDVYAFRFGDNGNHKVAILFNDISDRKHAAQALLRSESRLRAVVEQAPLGIVFTGPSGDVLFHNAMFEALWGRPAPVATAHTYSEVYRGYHLDGRPLASEDWPGARAVLKGEVIEGEFYEIVQASGDRITCWFAARPIRDEVGEIVGAVVMFRDVTDERRTHEALRASESHRRLALDAAELGTWHVDPATRATITDARYRVIFDTTEDWTDYFQAFEVIYPDDLPAVKEAVAMATRVEQPVPYAIEYRIVHRNGSVRWISAKGRSSFEGSGPTRRATSFDGTVADITERKQAEAERERLVARLQEQDQRKDEFLATLAHELRNPLAPIRNGLQILRRVKGNDEASEKVRLMMERQVGQMVHLIDDLLDMSRISRGKINLRMERIELAKAIEQAVEASQPFNDKSGHQLLYTLPAEPIYVDADLTRLTQVFSNLLNNAAKFTERGGRVQLSMRRTGDEAVVSVTDNGIGIPLHMLPHIFEMFTQVDGNLGRSQGGLGIGLSIVQRLVQMHGGSVEVKSDGLGSGSEFIVRLPLASSLEEA